MKENKKHSYFDAFVKLTEFFIQAADYLVEILKTFDPDKKLDYMVKMHEIENSADKFNHTQLKQLAREFITPIECEDIILILDKLDDTIDIVDDVARYLYMYDVNLIKPYAFEFADIIANCAKSLKQIMDEFKHFRKSKLITQYIIELNEYEEEADHLHSRALQDLYCSDSDSLDVLKWTYIYNRLEDCCDAAEIVGNSVGMVIMKNT